MGMCGECLRLWFSNQLPDDPYVCSNSSHIRIEEKCGPSWGPSWETVVKRTDENRLQRRRRSVDSNTSVWEMTEERIRFSWNVIKYCTWFWGVMCAQFSILDSLVLLLRAHLSVWEMWPANLELRPSQMYCGIQTVIQMFPMAENKEKTRDVWCVTAWVSRCVSVWGSECWKGGMGTKQVCIVSPFRCQSLFVTQLL